MPDLLVRNVSPETLTWLKAEAEKHGRSLSHEAQSIMIRRMRLDGDLSEAEAAAALAALGEDGAS